MAADPVALRPRLWLLAGANGAGKSTFQKLYLNHLPFVNADLLAKSFFPDDPEAYSYAAARLAQQLRENLLARGISFCFETVFSHPSKIDFLARAKGAGYEINLIYIHLEVPDLNVARVAQRVTDGGHTVPERKIRERIARTLNNVSKALPLCDRCDILDNSSSTNPYRRLACWEHGELAVFVSPVPPWLHCLAQ